MFVKRKIVLAGGVFDLLHYGHIHFLKEAKKLGDYLIIALESDENVKRLKGKKRPFHNQEQRKETLEALTFVDQVIVLKNEMTDRDYENLVVTVSPNIIAVTAGDKMLEKKKSHAEKVNAEVIEIPFVKTHSTTKIAKLLKLE